MALFLLEPIMKVLIFSILLFNFFSLTAQEINSTEVENLYKVDDKIYRSAQPGKVGFKQLDSMGIKTILSLRNRVSDKRRAKRTDLDLERLKINTWRMDQIDIIRALKIIRDQDSPILIHCLHGSDRTGVVIASYRMVFQSWSKEDAIEEFLNPKYGYHEKWFPSLLDLIEDLDVKKMRDELGIN